MNLDEVAKSMWDRQDVRDAVQDLRNGACAEWCALAVFAGAAIEVIDEAGLWQPIETAPKDGTHILTYGHGITVETKWIDTVDGGWCLVNQDVFAWQGGLRTLNPKYWMPMPAKPALNKEPKA